MVSIVVCCEVAKYEFGLSFLPSAKGRRSITTLWKPFLFVAGPVRQADLPVPITGDTDSVDEDEAQTRMRILLRSAKMSMSSMIGRLYFTFIATWRRGSVDVDPARCLIDIDFLAEYWLKYKPCPKRYQLCISRSVSRRYHCYALFLDIPLIFCCCNRC